jgi:arsenate reductase
MNPLSHSLRQNILFVCTHNSARSQIAEAILRKNYGNHYRVFSAGTSPTDVNSFAIRVLAEIGLDITDFSSKHISLFLDQNIDIIVTVCDSAKENCPFFPGAKQYIHKSFPDPSQFSGSEEEILDHFRQVRNDIINWIDEEFGSPRKDQKNST